MYRVLNERLLKELESRYLSEYSTIVQHHFNYSTKHRCNHPTVVDVCNYYDYAVGKSGTTFIK